MVEVSFSLFNSVVHYYERPMAPRCHITYFESDVDSIGVIHKQSLFFILEGFPSTIYLQTFYEGYGRATVND
jgi:hypothetical protein